MAKSPRVMTAVYNVTCLRLCIIFSGLSVKRPRQQNYRSLLLLTINTRKMVTREKIGIGKLQLWEILSPGREPGIWASNAGASRVIREVSHVCILGWIFRENPVQQISMRQQVQTIYVSNVEPLTLSCWTRIILYSAFVNSVDPGQLASYVNSLDQGIWLADIKKWAS